MASWFFLSNLRPFPTSTSAHSPLITSDEFGHYALQFPLYGLWQIEEWSATSASLGGLLRVCR
jgi:hypothetical protein